MLRRFQVPQYVDVEDKVAFRLTFKQLGWFALGGVVLFLLWVVFEKWVFWTFFPFILALAAAFAFWRPAGLSLFAFLTYGLRHFVKPKYLVWDKGFEGDDEMNRAVKIPEDSEKQSQLAQEKRKRAQLSRSADLAELLDEKGKL